MNKAVLAWSASRKVYNEQRLEPDAWYFPDRVLSMPYCERPKKAQVVSPPPEPSSHHVITWGNVF